MKLYIDSLNLNEIREALDTGVIYGVTTNPFIAVNLDEEYLSRIRKICELVKTEVHAQAEGKTSDELLKSAQILAEISPVIIVKIPTFMEGIKAIKTLSSMGIKTTATAITAPSQALAAALAGATYVAPFIGRVNNTSYSGLAMVQDIVETFKEHAVKTEVLAASIKNAMQVVYAFKIGAQGVTVKPDILRNIIENPHSLSIIDEMNKCWDNIEVKWGRK